MALRPLRRVAPFCPSHPPRSAVCEVGEGIGPRELADLGVVAGGGSAPRELADLGVVVALLSGRAIFVPTTTPRSRGTRLTDWWRRRSATPTSSIIGNLWLFVDHNCPTSPEQGGGSTGWPDYRG